MNIGKIRDKFPNFSGNRQHHQNGAIFFLLWFNAKLFVPQYLYARSASAFETDADLKWRVSKISDEYLPPDFLRPTNISEVAREAVSSTPDLQVTTALDTATYARYIIIADKDTYLRVKRAYFPGWKYLLNGKEVMPRIVGGLAEVYLSQGSYTFEISFANTFARTLGNIISLLTITFILIFYGKKTYA